MTKKSYLEASMLASETRARAAETACEDGLHTLAEWHEIDAARARGVDLATHARHRRAVANARKARFLGQ